MERNKKEKFTIKHNAIINLCKEAQDILGFVIANHEKGDKDYLLEKIHRLEICQIDLRKLKIDALILAAASADMTLREILEAFYSIGNGTIPLWEIFDEQEAKGNCISTQVTIRSEKVGFHRFSTTYKVSYLLGEYILLAEKDYEEAVSELNNWKDLIQNR